MCQDVRMNVGAFEIQEPLPQSDNLHAIALLYPWVDAGSVGTMALQRIERHLGAREIAKLRRPGTFFDFTRYRPTSSFVDGERTVVVPNTNIYYAAREEGPDLLFMHLMEPHAFAERYIQSVLGLLKALNVKRYCRVSGMYNAVPHTRPLRVTGSPGLAGMESVKDLITPRSPGGAYQGPTSIMNSVTEQLEKLDVENLNFMVHLPHYLSLEEDYAGTARVMQVLCALYNLPAHLAETERGENQYSEVRSDMESDPQLKALVTQLEEYYDDQVVPPPQADTPSLAPNVEDFLREIGQKLEDS